MRRRMGRAAAGAAAPPVGPVIAEPEPVHASSPVVIRGTVEQMNPNQNSNKLRSYVLEPKSGVTETQLGRSTAGCAVPQHRGAIGAARQRCHASADGGQTVDATIRLADRGQAA